MSCAATLALLVVIEVLAGCIAFAWGARGSSDSLKEIRRGEQHIADILAEIRRQRP